MTEGATVCGSHRMVHLLSYSRKVQEIDGENETKHQHHYHHHHHQNFLSPWYMVSMFFHFCSHISLRLFSNFIFDFCPGDSSLFVILLCCFLSAWPIHFHRLYPISFPTGTWPVHFHTSLLVTPFVHLILRRRHWHASSKTWIRLVGLDACDAFQISHPDNKTKNTIINNKNVNSLDLWKIDAHI